MCQKHHIGAVFLKLGIKLDQQDLDLEEEVLQWSAGEDEIAVDRLDPACLLLKTRGSGRTNTTLSPEEGPWVQLAKASQWQLATLQR